VSRLVPRRRSLVVFDLDGTLVDSVRDLAESANELVEALGGSPLGVDSVARMVGDGAGMLVRRALSAAGVEVDLQAALARFLEIYDRRMLVHTTAYSGMPEALTLVGRRARLAVLTNKPQRHTLRLLEHLQLAGFFDEVIGGDAGFPRKPHPAGLQALMSNAGGMPALFVGDSPVDAGTAESAGCAFAFARYGFGAVRFGAIPPATSLVLEAPRDLVSVLDRFEGLAGC
jgi:phosphoglycolate phosphatase